MRSNCDRPRLVVLIKRRSVKFACAQHMSLTVLYSLLYLEPIDLSAFDHYAVAPHQYHFSLNSSSNSELRFYCWQIETGLLWKVLPKRLRLTTLLCMCFVWSKFHLNNFLMQWTSCKVFNSEWKTEGPTAHFHAFIAFWKGFEMFDTFRIGSKLIKWTCRMNNRFYYIFSWWK